MKQIPIFFAIFILSLSAHAQIVVSNFGGAMADGAVLAATTWVGQVTQGASSITIAGTASDDNGWGASGLAIDASGMNSIQVTAQIDTGNLASSFAIGFEDSNLNHQSFSIPVASFLTGSMSTVAIGIASWGSVDPTDIVSWSIGGGALAPMNSFRMTFDQISLSPSSVPEPSTYAAIAGFAALVFVASRRRLRCFVK
jgi:hypothetical protein